MAELANGRRRSVADRPRHIDGRGAVAFGDARKAGFENGKLGVPGCVVEVAEHVAAGAADLAGRRVRESAACHGGEKSAEERFGCRLALFNGNREFLAAVVQRDRASRDVKRDVRVQPFARVQQAAVTEDQPVRAAIFDAGPVHGRSAADPSAL